MILLITILAFIAIFYLIAIKPLSYWKDRGVVHTKALPIVGSSFDVVLRRKSVYDQILDFYKRFSKERCYGTYQFLKPVLYVKDVQLIKQITVKSFENFLNHDVIIPDGLEPLIEKNLFNLNDQSWRQMRITLSPSFTSSKMKMMFHLVSDCALEFTKHFEKQGQKVYDVEMKDVFTRFTNDAIATVAFGLHCNSLEERNNEFYRMGKAVTKLDGFQFLVVSLYNILPRLSQIFQLNLFSSKATNFFHSIIKENIRKREKEGLVRIDMIHLLLEARKEHLDNGAQYLTDEDIAAQALIFFFGGFETSSTLASFLAYEIALNPDIQKNLQDEIDETLSNCMGQITYEALHKMKYMDMVVSETLRKWPPIFQIDRVCTKEYKIESVNRWEKPLIIEEGIQVVIPVIGMHRDPQYFPDPEKFDPQRFNDDNKNKIEPYSYMPFGLGPRTCIASRFALMENKILIFHILSKFDIIPIEKTQIPLVLKKGSFNVQSDSGIWLRLKSRNAN